MLPLPAAIPDVTALIELLSKFYYPVLTVSAFYIFFLSLANHYEMRRFCLTSEILDGPFVSVLIPARNEELNIERCIKSLQNQQYKYYEILVLNDNSTDNTLNILNRVSAEDSRVKVLNGESLPSDWYGKPFAMRQLAKQAKGEILIFTDADTIHEPTSIAWAVTNLIGLKADFISGYIRQIFGSIGEILTIPLMFGLTVMAIPLSFNRYVKKAPWFSAAIGQFMVIRQSVLNDIGGCEAFKKKTSEDICLSRLVKRKGYTTRFLNICDHVKCRMYNGYKQSIEGIGRSTFDFLGKNVFLIFFLIIVIFFFLFFPFPLLIFCIIKSSPWTLYILAFVALFSLTWIFTFLRLKINWLYGFLWPFIFLNMIFMAVWSLYRIISGKGFLWKDRKVG